MVLVKQSNAKNSNGKAQLSKGKELSSDGNARQRIEAQRDGIA